MEETTSVSALAVTAAVGAVVLLFVLLCSIGKKKDENEQEEEQKPQVKHAKPQESQSQKKARFNPRMKKSSTATFSHPWLAGSLKGHSAEIHDFDFSPNGKYVITIAKDRSMMLWSTKEYEKKEHKFIRGNVELDTATRVKFSPDPRAFIVSLERGNTIQAMKIGKKEDGSPGNITVALAFPKKHKEEIIHIGIASTGRFVMTCSSDTTIIIWTVKGEILAEIDTHLMNNSYAAVSPCGRFVASSGFASDVKVWEICFSKAGEFQEAKRAFELKGHRAGVYSCSFNFDSTRMATVSKDGTWKYWDTNVQYDMNQDPYLLYTGTLESSGPCLISLSPDGRTVAMSRDSALVMCNAENGQGKEVIEGVFSGTPAQLSFSITGKYLLCTNDKHVHVLHNVVGYRVTIEDLLKKEKKATGQAMKTRIAQQIQDCRNALERILHESNGVA